MSKGALEDAKLYYALAVNTRRVDFDDLCDEIAETCTLTSADIKAVLDRVIWAMVSHLKNSELVQFGDLGNFRISVGSTGSATPEEFSASMLRKPKVVFHPGRRWCSIRASACRKCAMSPSLPATPSIKTMAQKGLVNEKMLMAFLENDWIWGKTFYPIIFLFLPDDINYFNSKINTAVFLLD